MRSNFPNGHVDLASLFRNIRRSDSSNPNDQGQTEAASPSQHETGRNHSQPRRQTSGESSIVTLPNTQRCQRRTSGPRPPPRSQTRQRRRVASSDDAVQVPPTGTRNRSKLIQRERQRRTAGRRPPAGPRARQRRRVASSDDGSRVTPQVTRNCVNRIQRERQRETAGHRPTARPRARRRRPVASSDNAARETPVVTRNRSKRIQRECQRRTAGRRLSASPRTSQRLRLASIDKTSEIILSESSSQHIHACENTATTNPLNNDQSAPIPGIQVSQPLEGLRNPIAPPANMPHSSQQPSSVIEPAILHGNSINSPMNLSDSEEENSESSEDAMLSLNRLLPTRHTPTSTISQVTVEILITEVAPMGNESLNLTHPLNNDQSAPILGIQVSQPLQGWRDPIGPSAHMPHSSQHPLPVAEPAILRENSIDSPMHLSDAEEDSSESSEDGMMSLNPLLPTRHTPTSTTSEVTVEILITESAGVSRLPMGNERLNLTHPLNNDHSAPILGIQVSQPLEVPRDPIGPPALMLHSSPVAEPGILRENSEASVDVSMHPCESEEEISESSENVVSSSPQPLPVAEPAILRENSIDSPMSLSDAEEDSSDTSVESDEIDSVDTSSIDDMIEQLYGVPFVQPLGPHGNGGIATAFDAQAGGDGHHNNFGFPQIAFVVHRQASDSDSDDSMSI